MDQRRHKWEDRYTATPPAAVAGSPSQYVVTQAPRLRGRILDVAGGDGRNALFLAQLGNSVELVDIAYAGLARAQAAARAAAVRLDAIQADLEAFQLPSAVYDAVINVRYLQRSLFAALQRTVKPGGLILFETFLIDQQAIGHPRNPDFLLQRGELRAAFSACRILDYSEGLCDTQPPAYLARMLAQRPRD